MKSYLLLFLLCAYAMSFTTVPIFHIDLDGTPKTRWQPVVKYVLDTYGYDNSFGAVFKYHNEAVFNKVSAEQFTIMATAIRQHYPIYAQELEGVREALARPEVTFEYLAGWAYFHELSHSIFPRQENRECTGILLSVGDKVIHGRNQDQYPAEGRNLVVDLKFYKNNKLIGEAVDWYWFKTGLITAVKFGVATLEENWRTGNYLHIDTTLRQISNGYASLTWSFREILARDDIDTYDQVVFYLENVPTASSLYNVVSGPGKDQGAIISRDPISRLKTYTLAYDGHKEAGYKYLVQTNYDQWVADPKDDARRTFAEKLLKGLQTTQLNELGVFGILNSYPIHNELTFYSTLGVIKQDLYLVFGQEAITDSEEMKQQNNHYKRYDYYQNRQQQ